MLDNSPQRRHRGEPAAATPSESSAQQAGTGPERASVSDESNTATAPKSDVAPRTSVMVVDDDDAIREALEDVLGEAGYDVMTACDGQQALELLHGSKLPAAILVDLWMPVMDGWQFLDSLLAEPRLASIPLVVLTAARDQRARELDVAEVLTKPVQLHQVLGVLQRLTERTSHLCP